MSLLRYFKILTSAKGSTLEGAPTSTSQGADRQGIDVQIRNSDGTVQDNLSTFPEQQAQTTILTSLNSLITTIRNLLSDTYNQIDNWFAVKVINTVPVTGIVTSKPSDTNVFIIRVGETEVIQEHEIKTFPVYTPYFVVLGTLENYGIFDLRNADELRNEGTIINEGLILLD